MISGTEATTTSAMEAMPPVQSSQVHSLARFLLVAGQDPSAAQTALASRKVGYMASPMTAQ